MRGIDIPQLQHPENFPQFAIDNAPALLFCRFPTDAKISLRAKRDFFDKTVALIQSLYFLSSLSIRSLRFYRISFLELVTLNYIGYASITFILRIRKPQDLFEAFEIDLVKTPSVNLIPEELQRPRLERWIWLGTTVALLAVVAIPFLALPNRDDYWSGNKSKNGEGALTGWAIVGFVAILVFMIRRRLERHPWERDTMFKGFAWYLCLGLLYVGILCYAGARLYMMSGIVISFYYAPTGIYIMPSTWAEYIGHAGS